QPRVAVAGEHHRNPPGAVVLVGHRVAVGAGDRHRQQIADHRLAQRDTVDQDVTRFAVPPDHTDRLTSADPVDDAGLEALPGQRHVEVVTHAAVDRHMDYLTAFD